MKPEKARSVEDVILRAAQMGQIAEKVGSNVALIFVKFVALQIDIFIFCVSCIKILNLSKTEAILKMHYLQVSEERLITLLEQINNQTTKQTKVTVCYDYLIIHICLLKIILTVF